MRLSDIEILKKIEDGDLIIVGTNPTYPFEDTQVQPCSIDLRLDNKFYRFKDEVRSFDIVNLENVKEYFSYFEVKDKEGITLQPNDVLFGQIYEQLRIPYDCSGMIEGRSRFARLGLSVHATGGFINPLFEGAMPLQIINNNKIPITIYPFINICQLRLIKLTSEPRIPYPQRSNNPYHRETVASPSVLHRDSALGNKYSTEELIPKEVEKRMIQNYRDEMKCRKLQKNVSPQITIQSATIGILNTGNMSHIEKIESNIKELYENGSVDVANSIKNIKDAVMNSSELLGTLKKEVIEQLSEISNQANLPLENRNKKAIIKAILSSIGNTLNACGSLASVWATWGANISSFFNF